MFSSSNAGLKESVSCDASVSSLPASSSGTMDNGRGRSGSLHGAAGIFGSPVTASSATAFHSSLSSGKFSDLTMTCGQKEWKAHKVIVCAQSKGLEDEIMQLVEPAVLDLSDHPFDAVNHCMSFLYTSDYTTIDEGPDFSLETHLTIYLFATTFAIPGLVSLAVQKFRHNLTNHLTDLEVYYKLVSRIYADTTVKNPEMRLAVVEAASAELANLLGLNLGGEEEGSEETRKMTRARFLNTAGEHLEFLGDVLEFLVRFGRTETRVVMQELCEECGPRREDGYEVEVECKGCGKEKALEFA